MVEPLSRAQFKAARRLLTRKGREASGEFLAEGVQAVREALREPGVVRYVVVDDPLRHRDLVAGAADVRLASPAEVGELSDTVTPQAVVAVCRRVRIALDDVAAARLVMICAQVRDPGNAGTVIRCADAFGVDAVVLTSGSVDAGHPRTVRASVGSVFHVPVVEGVPLAEAVAWAHQGGLQVLAADGGGESLDVVAAAGDLARPTAWLMGNEAWGLPEADRTLADRVVGVPMWGRAESLNLATAAAVCLYATASAQRAG